MDYLQWLAKEDYQLVLTDDSGVETEQTRWSRLSKYGSPPCAENGRMRIEITKVADNLFQMSVLGKARDCWVSVSAYDIEESVLIRRGRDLEHRMVDAWREMAA